MTDTFLQSAYQTDMSQSDKDIIDVDPTKWDLKDLVRHMFLEQQEMKVESKEEFKELREEMKEHREVLSTLEEDLKKRVILQEQAEKRQKFLIAGAGVVGGIVTTLIRAIIFGA